MKRIGTALLALGLALALTACASVQDGAQTQSSAAPTTSTAAAVATTSVQTSSSVATTTTIPSTSERAPDTTNSTVSTSTSIVSTSMTTATQTSMTTQKVTTTQKPTTTKKPTTTQKVTTTTKTPTTTKNPTTTVAKPQAVEPTPAMLQTIKEYFLFLVNVEREQLGVAPLTTHDTLDGGAAVRAVECFTQFSHTRPNGESWSSLFEPGAEFAYPYCMMGENISYSSNFGEGYVLAEHIFVGSPAQLEAMAAIFFTLFKNSPPHYASMICEDYTETGIGLAYQMDRIGDMDVVYFTCVQIFGDR